MRISEETMSIGNQARITDLLTRIHGWGVARNIIGGASPQAQFLKLVEESEELQTATLESNLDAAQDALGDILVVGAMIAGQLGKRAEYAELVLDAARDDVPYTDGSPQSPYVYPDIATGTNDLLVALGRLAAPLARGKDEETMRGLYMVAEAAMGRYVAWMSGCFILDGIEHESDHSADVVAAALKMAWDAIKGRTGVVFNGVFIKSDDFVYPEALLKLGRKEEAAVAREERDRRLKSQAVLG